MSNNISGGNMSEEAYDESGGEPEDIAEEQSSEDYDSENSEYIEEGNHQKRHPDDKLVRSMAESKLEKKLTKLRVSRDNAYDERNIEELSEEDVELLEQELREARSFPEGLTSIDGYIKAWESQGKAPLKDVIKGLGYLVKGFIDVGDGEDVYEKIDRMENTPILYIPGAWDYPEKVSEIEEHSGYDIAHIKERKDVDKINDIIEYTIMVTGQKPILIGFSDGAKSAEKWANKYGTDKVSMIYALAASKFDVKDSNKLVFINGKKDRLAIIEKDFFKKTDSDVFEVEGGHTWMCYDPETIQQIFAIIKETARVEGRNFEVFEGKES